MLKYFSFPINQKTAYSGTNLVSHLINKSQETQTLDVKTHFFL